MQSRITESWSLLIYYATTNKQNSLNESGLHRLRVNTGKIYRCLIDILRIYRSYLALLYEQTVSVNLRERERERERERINFVRM